MIRLALVGVDRRSAHRVLSLKRPTVTAPSSPGNSPDRVKRSSFGDDEKVHRSEQQWQSSRLPTSAASTASTTRSSAAGPAVTTRILGCPSKSLAAQALAR